MRGSCAKILLVDDNEPNLLALRQLLRRDDVEMLEARSGRDALELLLHHDIALAFIDVQMPIMDGFELAELMRGSQRSRHVPIIFLTAGPQDNLRRFQGYTAGAVDFLYKPIEPHVLQSKAGIFLELYQQRAELARQRDDMLAVAEEKARLLQEREEADRRLRESEERFRTLADSAPVFIWMNGANGYEFLNQAYLEFLGSQHPHQGEQLAWAQFIHPDDYSQYLALYDASVKQRARFEASCRFRRHDGEYRWIRSVGMPSSSAREEFMGYVGAGFDMTDSKEAADRLQRWSVDLERAVTQKTAELLQSQERLRALATELNLTEQRERQRLATELHDHLAQLLVLGKLKLAQALKSHDLPPATHALLKEIDDVLIQSLTYTRTLVADLAPPVLQEFGLCAAFSWLAEQMKRYGMIITADLPRTDDLRLPADRLVLLFQSVRELLMNAAKHAHIDRASVLLERSQDELRIHVRDKGVGFDSVSLASAPGGTSHPGFGLFSIRERMLALGGRFELVSTPGQGTQATLILPLPVEPQIPLTGGSSQPSRNTPTLSDNAAICESGPPNALLPAQPKIRLLLADDHAMVRQGLRGALNEYANIHVVGEAANGIEAMRLTGQTKPDIILMDVNMPKMDGIEATRRIKSTFPSVRVIGLSVQKEEHVRTAMQQAGAIDFLQKDAAIEDLYRAIQVAGNTRESSVSR